MTSTGRGRIPLVLALVMLSALSIPSIAAGADLRGTAPVLRPDIVPTPTTGGDPGRGGP